MGRGEVSLLYDLYDEADFASHEEYEAARKSTGPNSNECRVDGRGGRELMERRCG